MKFADENAEDKFIELNEKYGLQHINSNSELTVEDLERLEITLKRFNEEHFKEV